MLRPRMNQGKFYLGHLLQVPVYIGWEAIFLLIFAYNQVNGRPAAEMLIAITALVLTIVLHEFGHALVARAVRMRDVAITISALGGYCTYSGEPSTARKIAITAAGPLTNFALAGAAWSVLHYDLFRETTTVIFCSYMLVWNLVLGIFNSLPLYPLDGGQLTLAIAKGVCRNQATAFKITLTLAVISAFGVVALDAYMHHGQPSMFNMALMAMLLFTAFAALR